MKPLLALSCTLIGLCLLASCANITTTDSTQEPVNIIITEPLKTPDTAPIIPDSSNHNTERHESSQSPVMTIPPSTDELNTPSDEVLDSSGDSTSQETAENSTADPSITAPAPTPTIPTSPTPPPTPEIIIQHPIEVMSPIQSLDTWLTPPSPEVYGARFDDAQRFYESLLRGTDESIEFVFSGETKSADAHQWIDMLEQYMLHNRLPLQATWLTSKDVTLILNTQSLHAELQSTNDCLALLHKIGVRNGIEMTDAVIKINDWMRKHLTYELSARLRYEQAYLQGKANCEGYARLFDRLCALTNITCDYETGLVKSDNTFAAHAWNCVTINSTKYYIDVCWNDSSKPNRYLLSTTLWDNHTTSLDLNFPTLTIPSNVVSRPDKHSHWHELIQQPLPDNFGEFYDAAVLLYQALLNENREVRIVLPGKYEEANMKFVSLVHQYMLPDVVPITYSSLSYKPSTGTVTAVYRVDYATKALQDYIALDNAIDTILTEAGITNGMSEVEAFTRIAQWIIDNTTYIPCYNNWQEVIATHNIDTDGYAPLLQVLCEKAGISAKIVHGFMQSRDGNTQYSHEWLQVKFGDEWYYTDISYYFNNTYKNYSQYKYFLSQTLWDTHFWEKT